jgi:hypothetical protein
MKSIKRRSTAFTPFSRQSAKISFGVNLHLKWVELPACPQGKQKTKIEPWTQSKSLCIIQRETNKMRKQLGRQRLGGVLPRLVTRPLQVVCRFTIMSAASEMLAFSFARKIGP